MAAFDKMAMEEKLLKRGWEKVDSEDSLWLLRPGPKVVKKFRNHVFHVSDAADVYAHLVDLEEAWELYGEEW